MWPMLCQCTRNRRTCHVGMHHRRGHQAWLSRILLGCIRFQELLKRMEPSLMALEILLAYSLNQIDNLNNYFPLFLFALLFSTKTLLQDLHRNLLIPLRLINRYLWRPKFQTTQCIVLIILAITLFSSILLIVHVSVKANYW